MPEKVAEALEVAGAKRTLIVFEYFFSAHAIAEEGALDSMKKSVEHWKRALARGERRSS